MTEVLFYHLQQQPIERVLSQLLQRSYERGWRVVVQAASEERIDALDAHLWTYRDDTFLPHGTAYKPLCELARFYAGPEFEFRVTGAMLTNFHLPRTSLLLLVCAFAGKDFALAAYRHAVEQKYRFYSYGDCMLIV